MSFAIYSYNGAGASMRFLSKYLGDAPIMGKRRPADWAMIRNKILINYGSSGCRPPYTWPDRWLNRPDAITSAVHKLRAFNLFARHGVNHPIYTLDKREAQDWVREGKIVMARATDSGSEGRGITVVSRLTTGLPVAQFYSVFLDHDEEYRVHVVKDRVIAVGRKIKKESDADHFIRNMDNGWVFRLNVHSYPSEVANQGLRAVAALGMDFGAADVAYCASTRRAYVLEVNSAPRLVEATAERYADAFRSLL